MVLNLSAIAVVMTVLASSPGLASADDAAASFRVRTNHGTVHLLEASLTNDGVTGLQRVVADRHMTRNATEPVAIHWQDIERVEQPKSGLVRGMFWGAVAGALTSAYVWQVRERPDTPMTAPGLRVQPPDGMSAGTYISLGTVIGAAAGGYFGLMTPRWETVALGRLASPEHRNDSRLHPSE